MKKILVSLLLTVSFLALVCLGYTEITGMQYKNDEFNVRHTGHHVFVGGVDLQGISYFPRLPVIEVATTTSLQQIPDDSSGGIVIVNESGDDPVKLQLPEVENGWGVWIIDNDATAAADVTVWGYLDSGDTVGVSGAGAALTCTSDAAMQSVYLVKVDENQWASLATVGTWANLGSENPGSPSTLAWPR